MLERFRSLVYSATGKPSSLPGLWERIGDDFAGCVILVESSDGLLRGRITHVPAAMRQYGWQVGDIKWKKIQLMKTCAYCLSDLSKELHADTFALKRSSYSEAKLYFLSEREIAITVTGGGRASKWRRISAGNSS